MKKLSIMLIMIFTCAFGFSQSQTEEQLGNMGIINGCNDAKATNANARYLQIMQSSAQRQEYKSGYDAGWHACYKTPGKYTYYKGVLVFEGPKTKKGGKPPKYPGHQTPWVIKVHEEQPENRN